MSRYDYWRVSHIHSPETKLSRLRAWLAQWYPERAQVLGFFLERWSELLPNERQHLVDDALTAFCESLTGNLDSTPTTFDAECRHIGFYNHASSQADLMGPKAGAVEVSRVAQVHAAVDKLRQVCVTGSRSAKRVQATSFGWWRKVLLEGTSGVTRSKLYRMDARIFEQLLAELTDLATSDIPNRLKPGFNVKDLLPSPDELLENAFNQATTPTNRYQSFVGFVEDAWHLCAAQLNEARKAVTRLESTGPGNPKLHEHAQHVATAQHDLGQREAHLNDVNRALASLKEPLSLQLFDELGKARQVWVVNKAREVVYQQCATFESTGRWHVPENLVKELLDLLKDPVTKATLSRRAACIHALSRTVNYYASNADASQETGIKHLRELLVALEQSESVTLFSTFTDTCVDECHRIFEHFSAFSKVFPGLCKHIQAGHSLAPEHIFPEVEQRSLATSRRPERTSSRASSAFFPCARSSRW